MKSKVTTCAKERTALMFLIKQRIESKGVNMEQASVNMGMSYSYLDMVIHNTNPSLASLLNIEKELGIEIFKWEVPIKNLDKKLKAVFVEHGKKKK